MELKLFTDLIDAPGSRRVEGPRQPVQNRMINTTLNMEIIRRSNILLLAADDDLRGEAARLNNTTNRLR